MDHIPTCPKCGGNIFKIDAKLSTEALVEFSDDDGDHEVLDETQGDLEWDNESGAICNNCDYDAPLGQMKGRLT